MSFLDDTILLAGRPVTILRPTGNVATFATGELTGQEAGRRRLEPQNAFDWTAWFPSTASIATGEIVVLDGQHYIAIIVEPKYSFGALEYSRVTLYRCNSVVTVFHYNPASKKHDIVHASGVYCLITQVRAPEIDDDKALAIQGFRGKSQPFQVYAQESSGIDRDSVLVDQDSRRYRVLKDFDVFVGDGIVNTQVRWEQS